MLLCIANVLPSDALKLARELLQDQPFLDGQDSAGWSAKAVKNNRQLDRRSKNYARLQKIVNRALVENEIFTLAAMPKAVRPVLFSRYDAGMSYGDHVDNAIMGDGPRIRTDVSFTLFLSDPTDYAGGELVIDDISGTQSFKLPAGAAVVYPSTSLHRVATVTAGQRLVAVGWIQSLIRDPARRQIIFDLESLKRQSFQQHGKNAQFDTLSKCTSNLWRMWAEL